MYLRYLIIGVFLLLTSATYPCSCEWGGNFIVSTKNSPLVVKVKVIETLYHFEDGKTISDKNEREEYVLLKEQEYYLSIKVEVIQKLKGFEERKTFEIYGSNGFDCRESVGQFEPGKTYIFALHPSSNSEYNAPNEDEDDYWIWGCSEHWLTYDLESDEVTGYIFGKKRKKLKTIPLDRFIKKLR
jgi:hypothetical protein